MTASLEPSSPTKSVFRKRVCKACDRCRLKKSKCGGSNPCSRCRADNAICVFTERKRSHDKVYPRGYVEILEMQQSQLVVALQELYRRLKHGEGWMGCPLREDAQGNPLTHDILERLGVLKQQNHSSIRTFEDNLEGAQQVLSVGEAGLLSQCNDSLHAYPDLDRPPSLNHISQHGACVLVNAPSPNHAPNTPLCGKLHPENNETAPLKIQLATSPSQMQSNRVGYQSMTDDIENVEFNMGYDSPTNEANPDFTAFTDTLYHGQTGLTINSCLAMMESSSLHHQMQQDFHLNLLA